MKEGDVGKIRDYLLGEGAAVAHSSVRLLILGQESAGEGSIFYSFLTSLAFLSRRKNFCTESSALQASQRDWRLYHFSRKHFLAFSLSFFLQSHLLACSFSSPRQPSRMALRSPALGCRFRSVR
jgi:hypothetical protein